MKALLDGGAAVDPWDRLGRTAAHWAAQAQPVDLRIDVTGEIGLGDRDLGDWVQVLELLADHGADLNAKGFKGATPLALAMRAGNTRLADAIRRRGGRAGAGCGATLLAAVLTAVCGLLALQAVLALLGGS